MQGRVASRGMLRSGAEMVLFGAVASTILFVIGELAAFAWRFPMSNSSSYKKGQREHFEIE